MTTLRIFMPPHWLETPCPCTWVLFDSEAADRPGQVLREGEDRLSEMPVAQEIEVVIAAELVSFIGATLPAGNRKRVLDALPYLVEDSLMASPEQVHVVIAEMLNNHDAMLATIDKRALSALQASLHAAGIQAQRAFPATLLPALPSFGWAVVYQGDEAFVRTSHCSGMPLEIEDAATPPLALQLAIHQARDKQALPDSISFYGNHQLALDAWQAQLGVPCIASSNHWRYNHSPAMNFLQGVYAPPNMGWARLAQAKPAAIVLACILAIQLTGICIDWAIKSHQQKQLDVAMTSLFMETFPDTTAVVDAPLQLQRKYAEVQHAAGNMDASDFLPLLASISSQPGIITTDSVKAMDYQSGILTIAMHAPNEEAAQKLLARANSNGLNASLDNLQTVADGVDFRLTFKSGVL